MVDPYVPALQLVQLLAPPALYVPGWHTNAVGTTDPAGHAYPGEHVPEHNALVRPGVDPKVPAGHKTHVPAPAREYDPAGHCTAVALVEPAGHAYPAEQFPEHAALVRPETAPKDPAGHSPEHVGTVRAGPEPYVPGGHWVHSLAPAPLYVPAEHTAAVALVDPTGHAYPAAQRPEQAGDARPACAP